MTVDGVLLGAVALAFGILFGLAVSEYYHERIERVKSQMGELLLQQQNRIEALEGYIADHSDRDVSAEELGL